MSVTLSLDDVYELALRALTGSQVSDTNAHPVAESIRVTEADGLTQAGLGHLPQYCDDARSGRVDGHASPTWEQTAETKPPVFCGATLPGLNGPINLASWSCIPTTG